MLYDKGQSGTTTVCHIHTAEPQIAGTGFTEYGGVPKRLKGLASNTSRSVTRREGSNPSSSAQ